MKVILSPILLVTASFGFAQGNDYRSTEDGINRLLNNPTFIREVLEPNSQAVGLDKLPEYFEKYVPEYKGFKPSNAAIDESKLYFTGVGQLSANDLVVTLGPVLRMDNTQVSNLQKLFTGTMQNKATSSDLSGLFYKKGVDTKKDFVIDTGVDWFQRKMGTTGLQSGLISIAGGILGNLTAKWDARIAAREAEEAIMVAKLGDNNVYSSGFDPKPTQQDLALHHAANVKSGLIPLAGNWKPVDYLAAIEDYNKVIDLYTQNPDRAYYMYQALMQRGAAKMSIGAYRAAITDFYLAENLANNIINKKLPDQSIDVTMPPGYYDASNKQTYLKGKMSTSQNTVGYREQLLAIIARAFGKYRAGDYTGALADSKLASDLQIHKRIPRTNQPNDYSDIVLALQAMSEFALGNYDEASANFSKARLNEEMIADDDGDGITNFMDWDHRGVPGILDSAEGLNFTVFAGLPRFFPFDIAQVRGLSLYKQGKIDEAIATYENIVSSEISAAPFGGGQTKTFTKVGGDISAVYSSLSSFYSAKSDIAKAMTFIDKSLELNPDYKEYQIKKESYSTRDESAASRSAVSAAKQNTKSVDYFMTKHEGLAAAGHKEEDYNLLMEAAASYPEKFVAPLIGAIKELKDASKAKNAAALYSDPIINQVFMAHQYKLEGDQANELKAIMQAFENGLHFQDVAIYKLDLYNNPAYCTILKTHATSDNNNFKLKPSDVEKTRRSLDSIAADQEKDPRLQDKMVKKMMAEMRVKQDAKLFGTIEQYLKALQESENKFAAAPNEVLDQIECLIILKREGEAVKFANQVLKSKKMESVTKYVTDDLTKSWVTAINNIASGSCGK